MTGRRSTPSPPAAVPLRVLMVEDDPFDAELVIQTLLDAGYACEWERVEERAAFLDRLDRGGFDLILADHNLPSFDGLSALRIARERGEPIPFVLVSGSVGEEEAIESLKAGATDYVLKARLSRLAPVVRRALREDEDHKRRLEAEASRAEEAAINAALVRAARELVESLDAPVLLQRLCAVTAETLACPHVLAVLLDEERDAYVPASSFGRAAEWETMRLVPLPRAGMARLLERLAVEGVVESQPEASPLVSESVHRTLGLEHALFAALCRGQKVVGLLIASRSRPFDRRERRTAEGIAQLASLVLANAHVVEELRHVNQLKNDFVATLSHELRTPLNVIIGYHELLLEGEYGPLADGQVPPLRRAQRSAHDLYELVQGTLDLGRLETGRIAVDLERVDLRHLALSVARGLEPILCDKPDVRLETAVPADLPPLRTDPSKLAIVLRNLVHNALKFTRAGSVTVDARVDEPGIEIVVRDTGVGIPPAILPVIFDAFRQGEDAGTREYGGVGLGLYITRRLVEVLGGEIDVASEPGRGSVFHVWLPREWGQARI